jgi:endonuclease/exonuclease/phosphatase family metal-dependent hydrolase
MLKVMSWNLFWGLGAPTSANHKALHSLLYLKSKRDRQNIPLISAAVKKISPHILAVQEVDGGSRRNGHYDQVKEISRATGMMHRHQAMEKTTLGYLYDGNAMLSKIPFERVDHHVLPYVAEQRNFIYAEVLVDNKRVLIITTHLAPHRFAAGERLNQIKALCAFMSRIKMPIIMLGDFNCLPDSEEFQKLLSVGLRPVISKPTYPVFKPVKAYDNILVSKELKVKRSRILPTKLSDHFAVYTEIDV